MFLVLIILYYIFIFFSTSYMSQQQVSESWERIKTDEDIYFSVITVHIIFLPLRKVSSWCFCVFCGYDGRVVCAFFVGEGRGGV